MNFKIDTKEKFTVITPLAPELSANLTEELAQISVDCLQSDIKNVVVNLKNVDSIPETAATNLLTLQQSFYENNNSFVICEMRATVQETIEQLELFESMNVTPTESEAWDIVQMEEIERELMNGFDE
ncbi:anti-sigma factor antagonist [Panacibacter sp. DH6]|uniref:Anti-sigma factor antagonist n=1 Tax=Panacibacter microcysteis TaxID=2793269 RepID=A0A931E0W0_9BACT|nr:STAS domain-containing protein [Panacibacter microcysteis]MBG9376582.1 anti-sigma factor antagonist [Panacibacter microcysteis]